MLLEDLNTSRTRNVKKRGSSQSQASVFLSTKLAEAELAFINANYQTAIDILSAVCIQAPKLPDTYSMMALIYQECGDNMRALQLYALAAAFTRRNIDIWKKVAMLAIQIGEWSQGLVAISRVTKTDPHPEWIERKIVLLMELRQLKRAAKELKNYISKFPLRIAYQIKFGDMCKSVGEVDLAIKTYLRFIFSIVGTSRVDTGSIRGPYQIGTVPSLGHAEIVDFLSDVYFAVRQLMDVCLDTTRHRAVISTIVRLCTETVNEIRAFLPPDSNIAEIPMDIAMLFAIYQLRLRSDQSIAEGLQILNPILLQVEKAEEEEVADHVSSSSSNEEGTDDYEGNANDDNVSITYSLNTMFSNINNMRMSYDQEAPVEEFEESSKYENKVFFLRQRVRVCEEFCAIGVKTRAAKLLGRVTVQLAKVVPREAVIESSKDSDTISSMWCKIGQVYESLKDVQAANSAYIKALIGNNKNSYILRCYGAFLMNNRTVENFFAIQCLQSHFDSLLENIQRSTSTEVTGNAIPDDKNLGILSAEIGQVEGEPMEGGVTSMQQISGAFDGIDHHDPYGSLPKVDTLVASSLQKLRNVAESGPYQLSVLQDPRYLDSLFNAAPTGASHGYGGDDSNAGTHANAAKGLTEDSYTGAINQEYDEDEVDADGEGEGDGDAVPGKEDGDDNLSDLDVENENLDDIDGGDAMLSGVEGGVSAGKSNLTRYNAETLESELIALAAWATLQLQPKQGVSSTDSNLPMLEEEAVSLYCGVVIPILDIWTLPIKGVAEYHKSRALFGRRTTKKYIYLTDLAGVFSSTLYDEKPFLSYRANNLGRMIYAFSRYASVLSAFGREKLLAMSSEASTLLRNVFDLKKDAKELTHFCTLMSLNRFGPLSSKKRSRRKGAAAAAAAEEEGLLDRDDDDDDDHSVDDEEGGGDLPERDRVHESTQPLAADRGVMVKRKRVRVRKLVLNDFRERFAIDSNEAFISVANRFSIVAQAAAVQLMRNPDDIVHANILFKSVFLESISGPHSASALYKFLENLFPVSKLLTIKQNSVVSALLAGHEAALYRKHADTMQKYLDAFCFDSQQPLDRHDCVVKGLLFLYHYINLRREHAKRLKKSRSTTTTSTPSEQPVDNSSSSSSSSSSDVELISELGLRQETHYNLGRAFHEIKLNHLAVIQYKHALEIADQISSRQSPSLSPCSLNVTREAAHNLVLIYKHSGAKNLALELMLKYLTFDV
eukprot:gene26030-34630_t